MNTSRHAAALAAFVLLAASGRADAAPRYTKKETVVEAKQTAKTKAPVKKAKTERRRRPQISAEQFRRVTRAKVAKLTDAAIRKLKQLIEVTDNNDAEKPDFIFRLAEHFRDKKVLYEFRARELDEKIYQTSDAGRKGRLKQAQKSYEHASRKWMIEAVKKYLEIYRTPAYQKYRRMDEVLFNLAAMLTEVKRRDKAREVFSRLIRNYPQSKYIPDALLSFAEFYFNNNQVEKALALYQRVGKYPQSAIYGYAVYKQGWCWLNLKDPRRALELFVKVIRNANRWSGSKKGKIVLVKEAKKDAVRAYAHVGTPGRAWNFFKRIGGGYAMTMLERLANIYYDQGKFDDSTAVYKKLIGLNPKSKKLCSWQYNIVRATLSGKQKRNQVREVQRLAAVYQLLKKRGGMRKTALMECRENASAVLRELATTWHREAQKTQNQDTYRLAQYLYKEYLDNFPREKDAYVMSFYYAELLFKLQRWEKAADAYTNVVKMKPRGKHLKEAAYAAVISWKNALNVNQEIKDVDRKDDKKDKHKKRPIPPNQRKMIAAFDTYIKYVPNSPELVPIKYRKARIYYESNHLEKAVGLFADVANNHSSHELAIYSANLLLDALNILKRYSELERYVDKFLKNGNLTKNGEFLTQLKKLKSGIQRKAAEQLQHDKRFRECGEKYANLANQYPNDARWPELVYNAAICFEAAKLIGLAISLRSTLIKVKPEDKLAQKALYQIGANYHALAWYSRAATHYEQFAKKFPGEKEAPKAMQNAIAFRLGRAEYEKAVADARFFAKKYGGRRKYAARTAAVIFSLGSIFEAKGDAGKVRKHYENYLRNWGRKGGADRKVLAHVRIARALWRASCPAKGLHGACIRIRRVRSRIKIKKRRRRGRRRRRIELRKQCGPETKSKITVLKRNRTMARKAVQHYKTALRLAKGAGRRAYKGSSGDELKRRQQDFKYAVAEAQFHLAEAQFEDFLDVKFPKGLDFSGKNKRKLKKSNQRFGKYLNAKGKKLNKTRNQYLGVIKQRVAHWAIAAAARVGQLYQNFADALYTAPVPKPPIPKVLRTRDQREEFIQIFTDKYCDTLEDKAGPLEKKAVDGLSICLKKSTELSWYNAWSRLCERELNQIKPAEYPLASELRAKPNYVDVAADRKGVITTVK
ncbi:MAG: tetratricopeptide repeat protein [Myxococcales bacterium]|nr:tetratricopeptide repeat protein [Myxococcales bacterium]